MSLLDQMLRELSADESRAVVETILFWRHIELLKRMLETLLGLQCLIGRQSNLELNMNEACRRIDEYRSSLVHR